MLKVSTFLGEGEHGIAAIPLFGAADSTFEKVASVNLLPDVLMYIESLRPSRDSQYVLVNALGAGEFYGSNINGDRFLEAALIHRPDKWRGIPLIDRVTSRDWPYGYPTFYNAHPYAHHRNKDPSRAYGEVELAAWNDLMKRVELVVRVDLGKCQQFGGVPVWDKLKHGMYPDVSMGCFCAGTLVTMADGSRKPIEAIGPGERVLTHRGRPRRVRAVQRREYEGYIYSLKAEAHAPFYCTEKHPIFAVDEKTVKAKTAKGYQRWLDTAEVSPEWVATKDLGGSLLVEPVLEGTLTPDYATRGFARLLGYYLAEGHILRNKYDEVVGLQLSTHKDDAVHTEIEALCAEVATTNPPAWADSASSQKGKYIYVHDRWVAQKCLELAGHGAKTKRLAEEVLHWHPKIQAELVGAYANGDGCYAGRGSLNLSSSNRTLMFQLLTILPRLGIVASIQGLNHKAGSGFSKAVTKEWVIHIGKQYVGPIAACCAKVREEPVLKEKNYRKFFDGMLLTPLRKISKEWVETEVYNLDVEDDDSYLVGNLAVHNSKVPFDGCSICLDLKRYKDALGTFDPKKHRHPGMAVLEVHRKNPIRGISVTRKDYCTHARTMMNKILPDGRKVFVDNDFPRFFDISFVFIGADRTAKVMMFIKCAGQSVVAPSVVSTEAVEFDEPQVKTASAEDAILKSAFLHKGAEEKAGAIEKEVVPSQFAGKAIPVLTRGEPELPDELLSELSALPTRNVLATLTGLGVILRPREFEQLGVAQDAASDEVPFGCRDFVPALARKLLPMMPMRSGLGPYVERRVVIISSTVPKEEGDAPSLSPEVLRKIGSAYSSYRRSVMDLIPNSQDLLKKAASSRDADLLKLAEASAEEVFTPLAYHYLSSAFMDELPVGDLTHSTVENVSQANADVQRGLPSRNTWN